LTVDRVEVKNIPASGKLDILLFSGNIVRRPEAFIRPSRIDF